MAGTDFYQLSRCMIWLEDVFHPGHVLFFCRYSEIAGRGKINSREFWWGITSTREHLTWDQASTDDGGGQNECFIVDVE